jgi:3-oxoadipate enol-lactonase
MMLAAKKILINGIQVSYKEVGIANSLPVIFIHGFPFNKSMWEVQMTALSDSYRCIAYDVRGHGDSGKGEIEFSVSQFADDLLAFMDALKIEKAIVVGLSMGGYIALNAIKKNPEKIAGLVLCDTQCAADTDEGRDKRKKTIAFIKKNGLGIYSEESLKNLFAPASFQAKKEEVQFIHQAILTTHAETICLTLQALANRKETCSSLADIKVPVCIVVGSEDKITPPSSALKMNELINNSELIVIEGAGHLSNLENPEQFNEHLKSFLSKNFK